MVLLAWFVVLLLLAVWSLVVWVSQALLAALIGGAGHLPWQTLALPESWTTWLPQGLSEWLTRGIDTLQPLLQSAAAQMPSLAGGIGAVAWAVWAVGALPLLLAGVAAHAGLRRWQRNQLPAPVSASAPRAATQIPS